MKNRKHYTVITIQNIRLHLNRWYIFVIMQCIRKRETVSYPQYVYDRDLAQQKEGNCIISTICLYSIFCVSEREKLCHTYNIFMIEILCIRKRETVSYLQYVYDLVLRIRKRETVSYLKFVYVLDFVHQKEGNCIIPTIFL